MNKVLVMILFFSGCMNRQEVKNSQSEVASSQVIAQSSQTISKETLLKKLNEAGQVTGVQTSRIDQSYEIVSTSTDENYFIKNNRVVSSSRSPKKGERALMYWRNYFSKNPYYEENLKEANENSHFRPLKQLACDALGMGVLYDPNRDQVTRVFYYEKK